ncbi:hypothetical protein CRYUN_Cryun40dG0061600 [Craigia yunnanensis]
MIQDGFFSKSIGNADSTMTEFLAIREAFLFFVASDFKNTHHLIIESDSSNAVSWSKDLSKVPWRMKNFFNYMQQLRTKIKSVIISHIPKSLVPVF